MSGLGWGGRGKRGEWKVGSAKGKVKEEVRKKGVKGAKDA